MTTTIGSQRTDPDLPVEAVPVRHPGRWVAAAVILLLAAMFVHSLITNSAWHWDVVGHYLFDPAILKGLWLTIWMTFAAMAIGIVLGIILAVMRLSANPIVKGVAWLYIWFFRGTPVLVQLLFWNNIAALVGNEIGFGIPFGPEFFHLDTNRSEEHV